MTQRDAAATEPVAAARDTPELGSLTDQLPAELDLVLVCCRWPPSAERDAQIRAAAARIGDWNAFRKYVLRQRVTGLVYNALAAAGIELPAGLAQMLSTGVRRIARRDLLLTNEAVRLQRAVERAGVPALILKGPALAQLAYGAATIKQTRDIDLLIPPECVEATLRIFAADGYALASPATELSATQSRALVRYGREVELTHPDSKLLVELQWHAAGNPLLLRGVSARSPAQTVTVEGGATLRTLARDDLFAYLCVHGARHSWSRLKWLADLNALIATDGDDLLSLYRHAVQIGAGLCAAQALLLCRRLFDLQLPAPLLAEISSRRAERLVALALAAMATPRISTGVADVRRNVQTQFLLGRGWRFYLAQIQAVAVTPTDVVRWPLPRALHFLYPLLRVPLWLRRRAKKSIHAV